MANYCRYCRHIILRDDKGNFQHQIAEARTGACMEFEKGKACGCESASPKER